MLLYIGHQDGMGRFNNDAQKAYDEFYDLTYRQLTDWGCRFYFLKIGKAAYDLWIDDKSVNSEDFFGDNNKV